MTEGSSNLLAERVWRDRYRHDGPDGPEQSVSDSLSRVARALASVEKDAARWEACFSAALGGFRFLPVAGSSPQPVRGRGARGSTAS